MLRRPGYRLPPHVDPKRRLLTGILYLARPGDSDEYGTQFYRVDRPFVPKRPWSPLSDSSCAAKTPGTSTLVGDAIIITATAAKGIYDARAPSVVTKGTTT